MALCMEAFTDTLPIVCNALTERLYNPFPVQQTHYRPYTGCPHKKYTEIKINVMAKLLYIWEREIYL